ncbi:DUF3995 domain-containing protein [Streptomyces netropsis]|uniref:DUF3995 domain-containing protein n=1 Tax=Streptomyces netropsis TaxID=55404 RepID=A0A7W7LGI4_STRNE|nr:DUF3995 domain-containing protein [Streptomyces netropsis]MBB4889271.1 hypothetical protein [Streptomyces netropsis]GGR47170.1 hypothetical protein GCM10010219_60890 [Streptomyces netropsis]
MRFDSVKSPTGWAYAAAVWLALSFVWHLQMGIMYRDAMGADSTGPVWIFLAYDGLITAMSLAGVVCVLAAVKPWGRRLPPWSVRWPLWFGCALLTLRGVPGLVENITVATGLTPYGLLGMEEEPLDTGLWEFWKDMVINSFFFLGAVTLVPATVLSARRAGSARPAPRRV